MDQNPDQTKKIIRYIIKGTPFGEAKEVVKDLCKIISGLNPTDEAIIAALKEHNEDHLAVFRKDNDPKNYIVTSVLNAQDDFYVDQKKGLTVTVDQSSLAIKSTDNIELPSDASLNAFRDALELELNAYLNSYFKEQLAGVYVMYTGDASNWSFFAGVSAKNINLPNFYVGDWLSKWEITKDEIKGDLSVLAHYYEEGNVQLKNTNTFKQGITVDLSNPVDSAKQIIEVIADSENKHQTNMDKIYADMPDLFFKAMRRILPVTGHKMDWNVHVHKVAGSLKQ